MSSVWWCEEGKLFKVTIFILEEIINPLLEKYYNLVYNSPINIKKEAFTMEAVLTKESEEIRKEREELFRELDKGIRDMKEGRVIPCDEAIRQIREKYGLITV